MQQRKFPGWHQRLLVGLWLALLLTLARPSFHPVSAQESPLPTPTAGAQSPSPLASPTPGEAPTSPLPTSTPGAASQPISTTVATTDAPSSLAGTALTSPGAIAVIVLAALVVIGGVVRYRQRSQS